MEDFLHWLMERGTIGMMLVLVTYFVVSFSLLILFVALFQIHWLLGSIVLFGGLIVIWLRYFQLYQRENK